MLGMLPPKVKDHQVLLDALIGHLDSKGVFTGLTVKDCADPNIPVERVVKLEINRVIEDSKGMPNPLCCKVCPANTGVCPVCQVKGFKPHKRPCYIGAVTHLFERYTYTYSVYVHLC